MPLASSYSMAGGALIDAAPGGILVSSTTVSARSFPLRAVGLDLLTTEPPLGTNGGIEIVADADAVPAFPFFPFKLSRYTSTNVNLYICGEGDV